MMINVSTLQNSSFYENRSLLIKAKEFAAKKDVEALKDLSETEVGGTDTLNFINSLQFFCLIDICLLL